jgi:hypothetical protein
MASGTEVRGVRPISREEALGVALGLEPLHASLSLPGRLVRVFSTVVQISVLPMFHTRQELA